MYVLFMLSTSLFMSNDFIIHFDCHVLFTLLNILNISIGSLPEFIKGFIRYPMEFIKDRMLVNENIS